MDYPTPTTDFLDGSTHDHLMLRFHIWFRSFSLIFIEEKRQIMKFIWFMPAEVNLDRLQSKGSSKNHNIFTHGLNESQQE